MRVWRLLAFSFFFRDINRTDSIDRRRLVDVMFRDVKACMLPVRFSVDNYGYDVCSEKNSADPSRKDV